MPMNISTASWHTPQSWTSLESLTATQLTNIGEDLGFLYAKPWITVWQNTAPTTVPTTLTLTTDLSAGSGKYLFATSNGGSIGTNLSASAVGSFSVLSTGMITTPTSLAGLYKVYCQMMIKTDATAHVRVSAILFNSAGTQIGSIAGTWVDANNSYNAVSVCAFNLPMNAASTFGTVTQIRFIGQAIGATTELVGYDLNGHGPGTTPKQLNTFATLEYLGVSSTGSF
jgi:hypothetical protein